MSQCSFASAECAMKKKRTRCNEFLAEMERIVPWPLLPGEEEYAFGDAGYRGADKPEEAQGSCWHVAMQPGKRRQLDLMNPWTRLLERAEQLKASIRATGEHPLHVIKNLFNLRKVRCKGVAKNETQLCKLFGLADLVIAKRQLSALHTRGAS